MRTLLALAEDGRQVVAIAGNHDNQHLLDAVYRPVLGELGLRLLGTPKRPQAGGTLTLRTRSGQNAKVAALPFLSHRYAVRAAEVLLHEAAEHTLDYARRVTDMMRLLCASFTQGASFTDDAGFTDDAVNIVVAHATLLGGRRGGGERDVQTSVDYELPASMFPATLITPRSGICIASRRSPGPARSSTQGRRWRSTSARRRTRRAALVVTVGLAAGPTSGRCRSSAAGPSARCAAPSTR